MSDILVEEEVRQAPTDSGDHDKFAHYVRKAELTEAMVEGRAIQALCGKMWVPTRDGLQFPVCPECKDIWAEKEED